MITIHEAGASDFSTLGLGALTPTECTVEEKAGGLYELKLAQPITDDYRHVLIAAHRIIKAPAPVRETPLIHIGQTGAVDREIYRVKTGGARLNMRADPNGKILRAYDTGTEVVKLGQNDGGTWYQVALMDGGATGWMFSEYLEYVRTDTEIVAGDTPGIVQPRQTREQLFRIVDMEPDSKLRTVTAWAQHITYDLKGAIVVGEYEPEDVAADIVCAQLMARADHDVSDFHVYCAVDAKVTGSYGGRNILDCLLDPETGVAAQTGARVIRDNYDIFLLPDEERNRGVELRYGKNLLAAVMTESCADIITRIRPVGKDAEGNKLYIENNDGFVDSERIDAYPIVYSKEIEYDVVVSDDLPVNKAREQLKAKAMAEFEAGCDLASVKLDADFVRVELTEDYKHLANVYALHMYDSVPVIDRNVGIVATVRMVGYCYDGLLDRYEKTSLGDITDTEPTVQGYEIAPGSIQGSKIVPGSLSGDRLRALSIGSSHIRHAAIETAHIQDAAITRAKIGEAAIGTAQIEDAAITSAKIGEATIETANIKDAAIDTAKIALGAITTALIGSGAIGTAQIADGSITEAKIVSLNADVIKTGTLSVERLLLKGEDGLFRAINATDEGLTVTELDSAAYQNAISGTVLVARSITADKIAAQSITANEINVGDLFAAEATIIALNSSLIYTDTIQNLASRTVGGTNMIRHADGKIAVRTGEIAGWTKTDYCQSGIGVIMDAWPESDFHNEARYLSDISVGPGEYTLSFWCWRYGTDTAPVIRPNLYYDDPNIDIYFDEYSFEPVESTPTRYELVLKVEYTGTVDLRFVTMTPWAAGEVYFTDVKLERGNTATAWSPHPEEFQAGTSVKLTENEFRVTTPRAVFEILTDESGEKVSTRFDRDGISAEGEITAPNLAYRYAGPASITVNPNATGEEIAAGGVYRSFADALAALSNRSLGYDVTINIEGGSYGFAELCGLCGSSHGLTINGSSHSMTGSFRAANCTTRIAVNGMTFAWSDVGGRTYTADFDNCADVELNGCVVSGSGGARTGLYLEWGTKATVKSCEFYDVTDSLIIAGNNVDLVADNAKGDGPYFIWTDGANVKWQGTRPGGAWWKTLPSLVVTDTGGSDLTALSIDYGTTAPGTTAVTTTEFAMLHTDSYSQYLKWDWVYPSHETDEDDIRQGFTETVGRIYGCMWFDLSSINGRTINQAMLRLNRMGGYGSSRAVDVHLYGTTAAYDTRSGAPELTVDYGVIGSVAPHETATLTIPSQAAADLAGGNISGLVLYSGEAETYDGGVVSKNYARFAGETSGDESTRPMLTVTYS